jgi:splicing suppressor protein 51
MDMSQTRVCATCSGGDRPLLQCAGCKSVSYCNKTCQKAHWKTHKQHCAAAKSKGNGPSPGTSSGKSVPTARDDRKPFTAISQKRFLHDRTEEETFKVLIDLLRLRQEDEYNLDGELMTGTIYNQEPSSEKAFRSFIGKAKKVSGFLPPWWDDNSLKRCLGYSRNSADFSLRHAQEKHDIQETWSDNQMPMKLRMVAERVYGNTPGGSRGDAMLGMMMGMEGGDGADSGLHSTTLDIAAMMRGMR